MIVTVAVAVTLLARTSLIESLLKPTPTLPPILKKKHIKDNLLEILAHVGNRLKRSLDRDRDRDRDHIPSFRDSRTIFVYVGLRGGK